MNPILRGVRGIMLVTGVAGMCGSAWAVTPLTTDRVATGLTRPVFATAPPGDTARLFIVEQRGSAGVAGRGDIRILDLASETINATPFLSITGLATGGEQGLLGFAFDPEYDQTGRFYVYYTASGSGTIHIARGTVSGNPDVANAALTHLLPIAHPNFGNHNGGWIGFGIDGFLYSAVGDGGAGCGPSEHSQNTNVLLGKILRLDVSGAGYTNPPSNPFVGTGGSDEIWAYGLRNPWRCGFDRLTHDLYIADVGQDGWEEVSFQSGSETDAVNYGWDCMEGFHCAEDEPSNCSPVGCVCNAGGLSPFVEYDHGTGCSISGGYAYRGCAIPDLRGTYFYADYCSNIIWSLRYQNGVLSGPAVRTAELDPAGAQSISSVVSFGEDARGEIYIVDQEEGEIFKIVPNGPVDPPAAHDYDNDGDVDLFDVQGFASCEEGTGDAYPDCLCDVFDRDADGDVDLRDYAAFQNQVS